MSPWSVLLLYRDDDAPFAAGRIKDRLEAALGSESVFDFVPSDRQALLNRIDVVVAVVGRYWEADPAPFSQAQDPRETLQHAAADGIPVVVVDIMESQPGVIAGAADRTAAGRVEQSLPTQAATVPVYPKYRFDEDVAQLLNAVRTLTPMRRGAKVEVAPQNEPSNKVSSSDSARITIPPVITGVPGTRMPVGGSLSNSSHIVERYGLSVLGEAADWTDVEPGVVDLLPGGSADFQLTFSLPWNFSMRSEGISFGVLAAAQFGGTSTAFGRLARRPIDVFISYAREDAGHAATLADLLAQRDLAVWWDRSLVPGSQFDVAIEAALAQARCIVVIWSGSAARSEWVRAEASEGAERGALAPLRIDDAPLPLRFRQLHLYDLRGWNGLPTWPGLDMFVSSVRDRLPANVRTSEAP